MIEFANGKSDSRCRSDYHSSSFPRSAPKSVVEPSTSSTNESPKDRIMISKAKISSLQNGVPPGAKAKKSNLPNGGPLGADAGVDVHAPGKGPDLSLKHLSSDLVGGKVKPIPTSSPLNIGEPIFQGPDPQTGPAKTIGAGSDPAPSSLEPREAQVLQAVLDDLYPIEVDRPSLAEALRTGIEISRSDVQRLHDDLGIDTYDVGHFRIDWSSGPSTDFVKELGSIIFLVESHVHAGLAGFFGLAVGRGPEGSVDVNKYRVIYQTSPGTFLQKAGRSRAPDGSWLMAKVDDEGEEAPAFLLLEIAFAQNLTEVRKVARDVFESLPDLFAMIVVFIQETPMWNCPAPAVLKKHKDFRGKFEGARFGPLTILESSGACFANKLNEVWIEVWKQDRQADLGFSRAEKRQTLSIDDPTDISPLEIRLGDIFPEEILVDSAAADRVIAIPQAELKSEIARLLRKHAHQRLQTNTQKEKKKRIVG